MKAEWKWRRDVSSDKELEGWLNAEGRGSIESWDDYAVALLKTVGRRSGGENGSLA